MSCNEFQDLLEARADGELPPAQLAELEEHLSDCSDCRAYADRLDLLLTGLTLLRERTENVARRPVSMPIRKVSPLSVARLPHWAGLAAAVAAALTVVLWTGRPDRPLAPTGTPRVATEPDRSATPTTLSLGEPSADAYIALQQETSEPRVHVFMLIPTLRADQQ